jgi:hypothetical protein
MSSATGADDVDPKPCLGYPNALASRFHLLVDAMAHGRSEDPGVELSSREKDCLRWNVRGSHLGIPARSWVSAKTLSPFTSRRP